MYNMWGDQEVQEQGSPDQNLNRDELNQKYPKPLIAIDRDGVINICNGNIKSTEDFILIDGSLQAIAMIRSKGYKIAIIFDQPGISKNELTIDNVESINAHMMELFGNAGCPSIDGLLYNMSDLKDDIFAKPNVGMLKRLRDEFKVPIKGGYYIGDRLVDAKMAEKAKLKPILVRTGKFDEDEKKFNSYSNRPLKKKTKIFNNLLEFAESLP